MENEVKNVEKKKGNGILIIAILVILCLAGYICYDKVLAPATNCESSTSSQSNKNDGTTKSVDSCDCDSKDSATNTNSAAKFCEGEYYGEFKSETSDLKYTYKLNNDGTFTADFSGVSSTKGVYVINENTITFVGMKEIVGPKDKDPYYSSSDYLVADDCSYFIIDLQDSNNNTMKLEKK